MNELGRILIVEDPKDVELTLKPEGNNLPALVTRDGSEAWIIFIAGNFSAH